jgi:choloylglycine hydrolase
MKIKKNLLLTIAIVSSLFQTADACTRVLHVAKDQQYIITGRNMDWYVRYPTTFWKFPRGMHRTGLSKKNPLEWVSKYGSVVLVQTADGQSATADGMNEKGVVANLLYLTETKYPKRDIQKKGLASSIYIQYILDNFQRVKEAVEAIKKDDFQIIPVPIPNSEHLPTMHISISDATGDSAIIEFLDGKTIIHHSKKYQIMTNSPIFEKQLTLNAYWEEIGGNTFLPGTRKSSDRFVRASYYNKMLPEPKNYYEAIAGVMSVLRNTSSPFGDPDPNKPNISTTMWRTIDDQKNLMLFYESTISPNVIWIDLKKFDFSPNTKVEKIDTSDKSLIGELNRGFVVTEPLKFATP